MGEGGGGELSHNNPAGVTVCVEGGGGGGTLSQQLQPKAEIIVQASFFVQTLCQNWLRH